jgi:hypothetical protein
MTRRRSGRSGREHLAAIDGSRAGVARKGLLLEFTVDHPDVAQIDAIRKENAHHDRAGWLSGDHASNNDWRRGS